MNLEELEKKVIEWAEEKGIFEHSDPKTQMLKTVSEYSEWFIEDIGSKAEEIELGDIYITLILQAKMQGTTLSECLLLASMDNPYSLDYRMGVLCDAIAKGDECKNLIGEFACSFNPRYSYEYYIEKAYEKISKRTGAMQNGVFIKDQVTNG